MYEMIKISILVTILGGISSGIGGIVCSFFPIKNKKIVASLQEVTAGIMTGIVCFDMLPETFHMTSVWIGLIGVIIGIGLIYLLDKMIFQMKGKKSSYSITAMIIMISMGFHNFIEGMAIGSSFCYSISMGITVIIAIILHDIPEGMVVGISNKIAGKSMTKNILNTCLVGIVTGFGALFGQWIGNMSDSAIGFSLSLASGVMLYLVSCELIPNSYQESTDKVISLSFLIGLLVGALIVYL